MKNTLLSSSLLLALITSSFSYAESSARRICPEGQEMVEQQDWMVDTLHSDFNLQVKVKSYSIESLRQLRTLHNSLRNSQAVNMADFNQIDILCKRADCN